MLQQINFTGDPLPPQRGNEMFVDDELASFWMDGAISPIRVRTLVTNMFACLPPETLQAVGELLIRGAAVDRKSQEAYLLVQDMSKGKYPHFDDLFPELMININPRAPQRAIIRAVDDLVRSYKEKHGISETRRRDDRFDEYIAVWDLREGWANGQYDCQREKLFKQIAEEVRRPLQTVVNQYNSAFRLIFGHDYSPEAWFNGVGLLKYLELIGGGLARITKMRPKQTRRPREVPESTLQSKKPACADNDDGDDHGGGTAYQTATPQAANLGDIELAMDLQSLISRGYTNSQILTELDIQSEELVNYFRDHHQQA